MTDINELLERCRSGDPDAQANALADLRERGSDDAVPHLLPLLESADPSVRASAAATIAHLAAAHASMAADRIRPLLRDPDPLVRADAIEAAAHLGDRGALAELAALLIGDADALVRASAAEALGDLGDRSSVPALGVALRDPDDAVRGYAALALGLIPGPDSLDAVTQALAAEATDHPRAELLAARYRLDPKASLDEFLAMFDHADTRLADVLANIADDLLTRNPPPQLDREASRLRGVIARAREG